jgi:hypothetical protein
MKVDSTRLVQLPQPRRTAASAGVDDYSTILKNSKKHQQHDLQPYNEGPPEYCADRADLYI